MVGKRTETHRTYPNYTKNRILKVLYEEQTAELSRISKRLEELRIFIKKPTLVRHLKELKKKRYVSKEYRGLYSITDEGIKRYNKHIKPYDNLNKKIDYPYILSIRANYKSVNPQLIFSELGYNELPKEDPGGWGSFCKEAENNWYISHFNPPGIAMYIIMEKEKNEILFLSGLIGMDNKGIIDKIVEEDEANAPYQMLICEIGYHLFPIDALLKKNGSELNIEEIFISKLKNDEMEIRKTRIVNKPWGVYKNTLIKVPRLQEVKKQP